MKKLTIMTIVLAILLALTTVVCAAEVKEAKAGDEITLTFSFGTDAEGNAVKLAGYQGYITYNADELTYVKDSASSTYATDDGAGKIKVSYIGGEVSEITAKFVLNKDLEAGEEVSAELKLDSAAKEDETSVTVTPVTETVKVVAGPTQEPSTDEPTIEPSEENPSTTEPSKEEPSKTEPSQDGKVEPSSDGKEEPSKDGETPTEMPQTGLNLGVVGVIAMVVVAGAVVLIKRK